MLSIYYLVKLKGVKFIDKMFEKKELLTLGLFCAVYVSWGLTDSIQVRNVWHIFKNKKIKTYFSLSKAPFYPREASEKGASPSEYGFVFGIIHLAIFIW